MVEDYQSNYGNGWISVYRSIKSHWVWSDPVKLKWWLTILFDVNHSTNKVALGYTVIEVKRGQSAKSLRTWAAEFQTGVKSVTNFFDMLEKDGMIKRKTVGKGKQSTTLLTVCNYDTYQNKETQRGTLKGTQADTQEERNGVHEGGTNNNDNNDKNDNNVSVPTREEVEKEICTILFSRGIASVSFPVEDLAQRFHDNYESKGWQINGQRIVKWQPRLNQWVLEELKKDTSTLETQEEKEAREFMQAIKKQATNEYLYGSKQIEK